MAGTYAGRVEDFEERQAAIIAEDGYTITLPGFHDVFHIKPTPEVSSTEYGRWKRARERGEEPLIDARKKEYLDRKYAQTYRIAASPQPGWQKSIGSIMNWIDNVEDATSTAVLVGRFAVRLAPRVLVRFIPYLGWALLANDIMNLATLWQKIPMGGLGGKRRSFDWASLNPFSKKAGVRRATKLFKKLPGVGELIEAAQTLDNLTGIGLCLGGIMGAINDGAAGLFRIAQGRRVTVDAPTFQPTINQKRAAKWLQSAAQIQKSGQLFDDELHEKAYIAYQMGHGMTSYGPDHLPYQTAYDWVDDWTGVEFKAPTPTNEITRDMIRMVGADPDLDIGIPPTGQMWKGYEEDAMDIQSTARDVFVSYSMRHDKEYQGYVIGTSTARSAYYHLYRGEGRENLIEEFTDDAYIMMNSWRKNYFPQEDPTPDQWKQYADGAKTFKAVYGKMAPTERMKEYGEAAGIMWKQGQKADFSGLAGELWPEFKELWLRSGKKIQFDFAKPRNYFSFAQVPPMPLPEWELPGRRFEEVAPPGAI